MVWREFTELAGGGEPIQQPDWTKVFKERQEQEDAKRYWRIILDELKEDEKISRANTHAIKRLVVSYVIFEVAARRVGRDGAVLKSTAPGKQGHWNPWWAVLKDATAMCQAAEAELTVSPRRRGSATKVTKKNKKASAADHYLKAVNTNKA